MSGSNGAAPYPAGHTHWQSYCTQGVTETKRRFWGIFTGFLLGFGCDFAVWVLISGLRVLSESWVFRVLICAEAATGFGGDLVS